MPVPRPRARYVWRAKLNNAPKTEIWFNHSTRGRIAKPIHVKEVNMNNASININAFLNNVNLNTQHGVYWSSFISRE